MSSPSASLDWPANRPVVISVMQGNRAYEVFHGPGFYDFHVATFAMSGEILIKEDISGAGEGQDPVPLYSYLRSDILPPFEYIRRNQLAGSSAGSLGSVAAPQEVQEPTLKRVQVYRHPVSSKAWSLRAGEYIAAGQPIIEYLGVIKEVRSGRTSLDRSYAWSLGKSATDGRDWIIDATQAGNAARFINHSCDPNAALELDWSQVVYNEEDPVTVDQYPKLMIMAERDIDVLEEITVDYGAQFWMDAFRLNHTNYCRCQAVNCKYGRVALATRLSGGQ